MTHNRKQVEKGREGTWTTEGIRDEKTNYWFKKKRRVKTEETLKSNEMEKSMKLLSLIFRFILRALLDDLTFH